MKRLRAWMRRLAGLLPSERREREIADELESHLQMHVDDNLRSGMTPGAGAAGRRPEAGRGRAHQGGLARPEHDPVPRAPAAGWSLRDPPAAAAPGIHRAPPSSPWPWAWAPASAIFAFVDAALLKPLPYRDPSRLVGVFETVAMFPQSNLSYPDYLDWKKHQHGPQLAGGVRAWTGFRLSTEAGAQPATGARVSDGFFRTLGVTPVLGRDFHGGEDLLAAPRTVMLSYGAWQTRYGGSQDVLGKTVVLNGDPTVVIGVLPREFHFAPAEPAEFWTTLHASRRLRPPAELPRPLRRGPAEGRRLGARPPSPT